MKQSDFPGLVFADRDKLSTFILTCCRVCVRNTVNTYYEGWGQAHDHKFNWVEYELTPVLDFFVNKGAWVAYTVKVGNYPAIDGTPRARVQIRYRVSAHNGGLYVYFRFNNGHWVVT